MDRYYGWFGTDPLDPSKLLVYIPTNYRSNTPQQRRIPRFSAVGLLGERSNGFAEGDAE
jgi:hypothetical protein